MTPLILSVVAIIVSSFSAALSLGAAISAGRESDKADCLALRIEDLERRLGAAPHRTSPDAA